jgi:hypothetical protein
MLVPLLEFVVSPCARVDRESGVIRDVKVLGYMSSNGRRYSPEAVRQAIGLYEGIRVNVDHPPAARPEAERPLSARFGILKNVAARDDGLYGDLHYLRSHPLAEMTAEAAERMPETLGLSHNAEGRVSQVAGQTVVDEIVRVRSVDLVADPATTRSLFEGEANGGDSRSESPIEGTRSVPVTLVTRGASDLHCRRLLESAGLAGDDAIVEALILLPDDDKRKALVEAILRAIREKPQLTLRPRSCEPFYLADRPGSFPADAASFVKALR